MEITLPSRGLKKKYKKMSLMVALFCFMVVSVLLICIFVSVRDRARLIRDNDNERIVNTFFMIRTIEDIQPSIESNPFLKERLNGVALYYNGTREYLWGSAPDTLTTVEPQTHSSRSMILDPKTKSIHFIFNIERPNREISRFRSPQQHRPPPLPAPPGIMGLLMQERVMYMSISHKNYWNTLTATAVLFPLCALILLIFFLFVRHLYLRNREYRKNLESQKNLVILGTAASTLAHEIKNPLLSIRLQTGILKKIFPETGQEELHIIEEEVERLRSLAYRVNDFLREPEGNPEILNVYALLSACSQHVCGKNIINEDADMNVCIFMDTERIRSVFENLIRNALESGSPESELQATINHNNKEVTVSILDRGSGISEADLKQLFDPFFTRKSTGTGIGLAISKRFIEAAGGTLVLKNRPDGGVIAEIRIAACLHRSETCTDRVSINSHKLLFVRRKKMTQ
ncbi:MAG: HAMP domain-containing histidine kinase [Treponema sp.]|jgi:two-component system sensor histidine kinase HydH|nr:HAMP domain-containing histidine kinase [Treponema sp.]